MGGVVGVKVMFLFRYGEGKKQKGRLPRFARNDERMEGTLSPDSRSPLAFGTQASPMGRFSPVRKA